MENNPYMYVTPFFGCPVISHLCHPQRHPYLWPHPGLIPHCSPAPRGSREKSDHRWAAYLKGTLHCCWVTSMVFSSACSDWTYTGHHLLCPLLMTMLTKLRSQIEWVSPQSRPPLHQSSCVALWHWRFWSEPSQAREKERWDGGHHESLAWRAREAEALLSLSSFLIDTATDKDQDENWWCYVGPFQFETAWQGRRPCLLSKLSWR